MTAMAHTKAPFSPVILSGGSGTRLWPLSRSLTPKQLLPVAADVSMLQATASRVEGFAQAGRVVVVGGEDHRFMIADQLSAIGLDSATIILEPAGRNTAAAIAIAAELLIARDEDAPMLVMPSDHVIADAVAFEAAVATAIPAALAGQLVAFGIVPESAETGYGYIEQGEALEDLPNVHGIRQFVEKPGAAAAAAYVEGGRHFWNAGIFLFRPSAYLAALREHAPAVASASAAAMTKMTVDGQFVRPDSPAFLACPSDSIDYAVMEHTDRAAVVTVEMGWSDVGSWDALWRIGEADDFGNVMQGEVVTVGAKNSLFRSENGPMIAAIGVEDLVVVSTKDCVLVVPRDRAQDVKLVVDELKRRRSNVHQSHTKVHRPWGTYETTDAGERFQTKRIVVKPGALLSLQMHHHRAEHWIVVSGTAKVTIGDTVRLLNENESVYIPLGFHHRLENPGKIPLQIIEVQCGSYLGEDDIVRFEDVYSRIPADVAA